MSSHNYHRSAAQNNCQWQIIVTIDWISVPRDCQKHVQPHTLFNLVGTHYLRRDKKRRVHLRLLQTLKSWDFFVVCLHTYPITILLSSPQRISAMQTRPERLRYLYAVCKTEDPTDWKANSPLIHALAGTRHWEPFCTTGTMHTLLLSKTTNAEEEP